jgi:hypothetical protein
VTLYKDAGYSAARIVQRLEHQVDKNLFLPTAWKIHLDLHSAPNEGVSGTFGFVQQADKALFRQFRHCFGQGLADEIASIDQVFEGLVRDRDAVIAALKDRHKAGRQREHALETVAFATIHGQLAQHVSVIQQRRIAVTRTD